MPLFFFLLIRGDPFSQWHKILSQNTKDSKISYGENLKSLSDLVLDRCQIVTDGQTDGQNYHS